MRFMVTTIAMLLLSSLCCGAELTEKEQDFLKSIHWPGQVNDVGTIIPTIDQKPQKWMRMPTMSSKRGLRVFAQSAEGKAVLRDLAQIYTPDACPSEISQADWADMRRMLLLLAADGGQDEELPELVAIVLLNPDGPAYLADNVMHPAVRVLGPRMMQATETRLVEGKEVDKQRIFSVLQHNHCPVDDIEIKLYVGKITRICKKFGISL